MYEILHYLTTEGVDVFDAWLDGINDARAVARIMSRIDPQRHKADVVVRWPGKPPTHGVDDHRTEAIDFFKTFPDQHLDNRPYKVFFASGDWTCSIARFTGTMKGPMRGPDGKEIPPTGRSFEVDFCTVARWDNGQIVEENLFYDLVTFMKQIGLG